MRVAVAGKHAYARFVCLTGDAMGMNMVSKGVNKVLEELQVGEFGDMQVLGLSGNMCCDKKAAAVNWIEGRGCSVVVEATIPGELVGRVLNLGRRLHSSGRTLGVRRPWRPLRQALEKARLVGQVAGAPAAVHAVCFAWLARAQVA